MSRISLLLVAASVAASVVGCAQCDTCDDFPTPCSGPNCNQNQGGIPGYLGPAMMQGTPATGETNPNAPAMNDSAGSGPEAPAADPAPTRTPATPSVDPTPPAPMETAPKPN